MGGGGWGAGVGKVLPYMDNTGMYRRIGYGFFTFLS